MNLIDPTTNRFVPVRDPQWSNIAKQVCSEARHHTEDTSMAETHVAADNN